MYYCDTCSTTALLMPWTYEAIYVISAHIADPLLTMWIQFWLMNDMISFGLTMCKQAVYYTS